MPPDMFLILPPWHPSLISEYGALPWLSGLAEMRGFSVHTENLNRKVLFSVAQGHGVAQAREILRDVVVALESVAQLDELNLDFYLTARRVLCQADALVPGWSGRDVDGLVAPAYFLKCLTYLTDDRARRVDPPACWADAGARLWAVLFETTFRDTIDALLSRRPRSVGFCLPYAEVVPAVFTLLPRIRDALGGLHVALGGPAVALATEDVLSRALRDGGVDSIVRYDAEDAFVQLLEAVRGKRSFSEVDNRLGPTTRVAEAVHKPPRTKLSAIPAVPHRLEQPILSPVSLLAAHGCFWGKCAYCCYSAIHGPTHGIRCRSPRALVDEVEDIHCKLEATEFLLAAESLPGRLLKQFAKGLLDRGLAVRWYCFVRPGPWYDFECLELMAASGFDSRWSVSIEAGSDPVLERMNRGYDKQELLDFLARCRKTGVRFGWANIIHDFPGTTYDQAMETFELVAEHKDLFHYGLSLNRFRLRKQSAIGLRPRDWGLIDVVWRPGEDGSFKTTSGMTPDEIERVEQRYAELASGFRPEAGDLLRLREAAANDTLESLRLVLEPDRIACCPAAFTRNGIASPTSHQVAVYPSGRTPEVLYFQYNVPGDFARAAILDDVERGLVERLLRQGSEGIPIAAFRDELGRRIDDGDDLARRFVDILTGKRSPADSATFRALQRIARLVSAGARLLDSRDPGDSKEWRKPFLLPQGRRCRASAFAEASFRGGGEECTKRKPSHE